MDSSTTNFVIIGAGPVGILTALAVAKATKDPSRVVVYEYRPNLEQRLEESYPIGVSPRGLRALQSVCRLAHDQIRDTGVLVDSWDIYAGARQVAEVKSGTTMGHTRFSITDTLYQQAMAEGIQVKMGYKLSGLDVASKTLTFTLEEGTKEETVDCRTSVVIAADGSSSATRRLLESAADSTNDASYAPTRNERIPWQMYFRVLVMDGNDVTAESSSVPLKPNSHSIYSGVYIALIGPPGQRQWVVVPSGKLNTPDAEWFFLESDNPSTEMMDKLRKYLAEKIPPIQDTEKYFTDSEIKAFFSRRLFTGSLISLAPLNYPHNQMDDKSNNTPSKEKSWIVFLGDSAHGVFPATGEGLNSGLDDVYVLCQTVLWPAYGDPRATLPKTDIIDLAAYAEERQPDVDALSILAKDILTMTTGTPKMKAMSLMTTILAAMARSLRLIGPSEAELRYGPNSDKELLPYREVLRRHLRDTFVPRTIATGIVSLYYVLSAPFGLIASLIRANNKALSPKAE